jgi:polar amino acid transport system substrate-binding protein
MPTRRFALVAVLAMVVVGCSSSAPAASGQASTPAASGGVASAPAASAAASAPASGGALARAKAAGKLTVGISAGAPIGFVDASGNAMGVMVDICKKMIEREGIKELETFLMPFSSEIPALTSNRIELGCDSFFPTDKRKEVVNFTDIVFYNSETMVVGKGNPKNIHKLEDLKGMTAGSFEGTVWIDWLNDLNKTGANITVKAYPSPTELLADVAAGRLDAAIVDGIVAGYAIKQNASLNIEQVVDYAPRDKASNAVAMPVRKDSDDIRDAVNKTLEAMKADGSLAAVFEKYGLAPAGFYIDKP